MKSHYDEIYHNYNYSFNFKKFLQIVKNNNFIIFIDKDNKSTYSPVVWTHIDYKEIN